jgi:prepilin-type N-terminal cleavage/methylation domain-containing protein
MPLPNRRLHAQRGFTFIEVMTASIVLAIFILGLGTSWIVADRRVDKLGNRQKAIFVANGEMARLTALYNRTTFGAAGAVTTTAYDGPAYLPATRLIYPTALSAYVGGPNEYITTSAATFQSGSEFQVWINSQVAPSANRSFVWINHSENVMARMSWVVTNITPVQCKVGSDTCGCLNFNGALTGVCQRLDLYLEYPYRLTAGAPVAGSPLQTVTLSSIVGRQT